MLLKALIYAKNNFIFFFTSLLIPFIDLIPKLFYFYCFMDESPEFYLTQYSFHSPTFSLSLVVYFLDC